MEMQKETENKNMSKVVSTSIGTVSYVSIKFVEKEQRKQEDGYKYRTSHKTYT